MQRFVWLKVLQKDGKLTTLDVNEDFYLPQKYFAQSEFASQIDF